MAYEDSFSFGTDIEDVFLDGGYSTPSSPSSSSSGSMVPEFLNFGADVLKGVGAYMMGQEEAGAYKYNAELALIQGRFETEQLDKAEGETLSTQKAMYAKAGVEYSGSPLDTALQTATNYEYDKQIANFNAQSKANMYEYEAKVAKNKGEFGLGMGLLQGAGSLAMALF